jgi:hypothetical protein
VPLYARCEGVPRWSTTDVTGRFAICGLGSDAVELVAAAWGHVPAKWQLNVSESPHVLRLEATAGDIPVLGPIGRADLAGRVVRALDQPLDGYEVVLTPADPPETIQPATPRRALVGADGSFRFTGLVLARYVVQVLPAWARGGSWPDLLPPELAPLEHSAARDDLELGLQEGEIEGRVVDEDAHPVAGALVTLSAGDQPLHTFPWETTQRDGTSTCAICRRASIASRSTPARAHCWSPRSRSWPARAGVWATCPWWCASPLRRLAATTDPLRARRRGRGAVS